jgi:acetolactate synthase-1/3 small subunit
MALPRHILVALVEDKPGVLNRVSGLFRRRGFNIASLAVGHSETPKLSRMTLVVEGGEGVRIQAARQLRKVVGVMEVKDITATENVARELALIKLRALPKDRNDIMNVVSIFRADIIDVDIETMIIQATGDADKIEALQSMLRPFGVLEMMRTGEVAMARGAAGRRDNGVEEAIVYEDIGGV